MAAIFQAQLVFDSWPFITRVNYKYAWNTAPFFFYLCSFFKRHLPLTGALPLIPFHIINLALVPGAVTYDTWRRRKPEHTTYRSRVHCSIWPEPVRQTREALSKMSEIHVRLCFPSFPDNFQNEAIFGCNLLCLLPIKRDYRSINIVYVAKGASHFLSQSRFIFLEEHKGKIISCHYLER